MAPASLREPARCRAGTNLIRPHIPASPSLDLHALSRGGRPFLAVIVSEQRCSLSMPGGTAAHIPSHIRANTNKGAKSHPAGPALGGGTRAASSRQCFSHTSRHSNASHSSPSSSYGGRSDEKQQQPRTPPPHKLTQRGRSQPTQQLQWWEGQQQPTMPQIYWLTLSVSSPQCLPHTGQHQEETNSPHSSPHARHYSNGSHSPPSRFSSGRGDERQQQPTMLPPHKTAR